jgi:orotidine-5'-phosphate decarboxylase
MQCEKFKPRMTRMKDKLIVALDVETPDKALELVKQLRDVAGMFKIGSQLFTSAGPQIVRDIIALDSKVFLDLKFHDIPNTVAGAVRSAANLGVWMVNVHAAGGRAMMIAAREAADHASRRGAPRTFVIGVTVLTSLDAGALRETGIEAEPADQVVRLAQLARDCGLDGVVCSPQEIERVRSACGPAFLIVTPGIRGAGDAKGDQVRTATPAGAVQAGADYLVIGRPITAANDPAAAADRIAAEIGR